MGQSRVLIIYTGGTIGMQPTSKGYAPNTGFSALLTQRLGENKVLSLQPFDLIELDTLIDSSNVTPNDWSKLSALIAQHYDDYDGFVVLHGTDTMAYTASALSFMLKHLDKPVVITGSQIPLVETRTDAITNLLSAIAFARLEENRQVSICFDGLLLQGNRASKVHTSNLNAFHSPNLPPIGKAGIHIELNAKQEAQTTRLRTYSPTYSHQVAVLHLYPGIPDSQLDAVFKNAEIKGVILLTFGAGNPPDGNEHLMSLMKKAAKRNLVMVNVTQCPGGRVIQGAYATGAKLNKIGVVSGSDMTLEAAFTKLHFLLASETDTDEIKNKMRSNLAGELSC